MQYTISSFTSTAVRPNWLIALIGALILVSSSATAEYKLQSGDTLEIAVTGVPDLKQRLPVELDGEISLPLVGQVKVGGLSLAEARATITGKLSNKIYLQPSGNGREIQRLLLPNEIVVTVAEYRPIYVSGHVAKPGEYAFRPGMTVRQAIAIAGGYNLAQPGLANPFLQAADFRSEYEALLVEFAAEQDWIWRLRTELGESEGDYSAANKAPIPDAMRERLKQTASEHLKARMADRKRDKQALQEAIDRSDLELGVLAEKKKTDEEGNQADNEEFERVRQLFKRNIATNSRLSEARRAAFLSSNQLLQTIVQISNVQRQRSEYGRWKNLTVRPA